MSFTRFRKSEKSKASSIQGSQDVAESVHQNDNLSQCSHHSNNQYDYQPKQNTYTQQKQINQPYKYNNDINNIQRSEHNSQNPSVSSSSSSPDQFICNNCINDALIYEKQLNSRLNENPNGESPLDMQKRLNAIKREQINNKINQRQGLAQQVGKNLGKPTNKDLLIQVDGDNNIYDNVSLIETYIHKKRIKCYRDKNYDFSKKINEKFLK